MVKKYHYFGYVLSVFLGLFSGLLVYFWEIKSGVTGFDVYNVFGGGFFDVDYFESTLVSGGIFGVTTSLLASLLTSSFQLRVWMAMILGSIASYMVAVFFSPWILIIPLNKFLTMLPIISLDEFLIITMLPTGVFLLGSAIGSMIFALGFIFSSLKRKKILSIFKILVLAPLPGVLLSAFVLYWLNGFTSQLRISPTYPSQLVFAFLHPLWHISTLCALVYVLERGKEPKVQ